MAASNGSARALWATWIAVAGCAATESGDDRGDSGVVSLATSVASTGDGSSGDHGSEDEGTSGHATTVDADTGAAPAYDVGAGETGDPPACDPADVPDTLEFEDVSVFETGIVDQELQASFYDSMRGTVTIMSFGGDARRFQLDGTPAGDVFDVAPLFGLAEGAALRLDGATYDAVRDRALLINQLCMLVETDPLLGLAEATVTQLDFDMSWCAGLALGLDDKLYIASYGTEELVVISRDGLSLDHRVDMLGQVGLSGIDGISLIAGSENFLVTGTRPAGSAAIVAGSGAVVVPTAPIGESPLVGDVLMLPDAVLTICANGHAWLCEAYDGTCFDYRPNDGDKDTCGCLIPG